MKGAIQFAPGIIPRCDEIAEPTPGPGEIAIDMIAASIKHIDRTLADGSHYAATRHDYPRVVGIDGVGTLPDGQRVYTGGTRGMMAERAVVTAARTIAVPASLDPAIAAALPNPALSAWFSLHGFEPGQTLLVLGATGVTGKLAIQLAAKRGAAAIVAVGRDGKRLEHMRELGASAVAALGDEAEARRAIAAAHAAQPFDLVLDYLWGGPAELVLDALTGDDLEAAGHRTRRLQIGEMAGPKISLRASTLRSRAIALSGQGGGSMPRELLARIGDVLPQMFRDAAEGKLRIDITRVPLADVHTAWQQGSSGTRTVIMMQ